MLLSRRDLGRGTVTHQRDFFAVCYEHLDRPCKGIQAAREQDHLVRCESCRFLPRKLEIAFDRWRLFKKAELEVVVVLREKADCLDESRLNRIGRPEIWLADRDYKPKVSPPPCTHLRVGLAAA